jgi:hypothetical protein
MPGVCMASAQSAVWRQSTFTIKAFASPQGKAQVLFIIEHCVILVIFIRYTGLQYSILTEIF